MKARDPQLQLPEPTDGEVDEQGRAGGALLGTYSRGCCSRAGLVCATAQWGAINAMYFDRTRDGQAREHAFRSLNYATYFEESDGKINAAGGDFEPDKYWFEDGYGDAGRNFMWAMAAMPEFAPIGENHLLSSTSVVQSVSYGETTIEYRTFDHVGTERLRLSFKPGNIVSGTTRLAMRDALTGPGYTVSNLPGGDFDVRVRHEQSNQVAISK
jgi:hypothetical protein